MVDLNFNETLPICKRGAQGNDKFFNSAVSTSLSFVCSGPAARHFGPSIIENVRGRKNRKIRIYETWRLVKGFQVTETSSFFVFCIGCFSRKLVSFLRSLSRAEIDVKLRLDSEYRNGFLRTSLTGRRKKRAEDENARDDSVGETLRFA